MRPGHQHPDRASWLAARRIGASDVAAILGVAGRSEDEPHRSPWDVWARLVGLEEGQPETSAMRRGRAWESVVTGAYQGERPGIRVRSVSHALWTHPSRSWATASPDAIAELVEPRHDFDDGPTVWAVEAKTDASPARAAWGDSREIERWGPGCDRIVRPDYALQAYYQAWVIGLPWVDLAVLLPFYDLRVFRIHADPEVEAALDDQIGEWHRRHVVGDVPPRVDGSDACLGWLRDRFPGGEGPRIATEDEAAMVRRYAALKAAVKAAEEECSDLRARLLEAAGNADRIDLAEGPKPPRLTVIRSEREGAIDWRRLLEEHPDIDIERYRRPPVISTQLRTYNLETTP